jgi:hypothetical protein
MQFVWTLKGTFEMFIWLSFYYSENDNLKCRKGIFPGQRGAEMRGGGGEKVKI